MLNRIAKWAKNSPVAEVGMITSVVCVAAFAMLIGVAMLTDVVGNLILDFVNGCRCI